MAVQGTCGPSAGQNNCAVHGLLPLPVYGAPITLVQVATRMDRQQRRHGCPRVIFVSSVSP